MSTPDDLPVALPVESPTELPVAAPGNDSQDTEDFAALLRANDRDRAAAVDRTGSSKQIDATVVAVSADTIYLDIGYKTEGILPLKADAPAEPGDRIRVTVRGRNLDGYYELTRQRGAVTPQDFSSLEEAFEARGTVLGTVTGATKGGLTVDIGMRAFLPASRSGTRDAAEMGALVGQEIRVRITELNLEGGERSSQPDAVVDRRSVLEDESRALSDQRFSELAEGQTVHGTVRSLTDFGAFVDLAGADALLHISDMAWHRVGSPADVVAVGDQVDVQVLRIDTTDPAKRRIAVGLKQLQPHPWDAVPANYKLGDKVRGIVTRDADFGSFVEVAPGVEGLIHISEMAWGKKVHKPSDVVKVGEEVEAVILSIDPAARRMGLGLKQALGDPWADAMKTVHPGAQVEGKVSSITKFGAFVTVAAGVEGLVHISEITAERRLNHPSDELHVGQEVQALVLEVDREKRQLRLSIKQLIPTGLDEFLAEHAVGDTVSGRIIDLDAAARTARVELGEGIVAMATLPDLPVVAEPVSAGSAPSAPLDLSGLGAMLGSKWKTAAPEKAPKGKLHHQPIPINTPSPGASGPPTAGQVRSFRIATLEPTTRQITLELA